MTNSQRKVMTGILTIFWRKERQVNNIIKGDSIQFILFIGKLKFCCEIDANITYLNKVLFDY